MTTGSQIADILSVVRFLAGLAVVGVMAVGFFAHANFASAALVLVVLAMLTSIASEIWLRRSPVNSDDVWGAILADTLFLLLAALGIGFSRQRLCWAASLVALVLMLAWVGIIAFNSKKVLLWNRAALVCNWIGALVSLATLPLYASVVFGGHRLQAYVCLGMLAVVYGVIAGRRMMRLVFD